MINLEQVFEAFGFDLEFLLGEVMPKRINSGVFTGAQGVDYSYALGRLWFSHPADFCEEDKTVMCSILQACVDEAAMQDKHTTKDINTRGDLESGDALSAEIERRLKSKKEYNKK